MPFPKWPVSHWWAPLIQAVRNPVSPSLLKGRFDRITTKLQIPQMPCKETESCAHLDQHVLSTVDTAWNLKGPTQEVPPQQRRDGVCFLHSLNREVPSSHGLPIQTKRLLSRAAVMTHIFSRSKVALEILSEHTEWKYWVKVQSPV